MPAAKPAAPPAAKPAAPPAAAAAPEAPAAPPAAAAAPEAPVDAPAVQPAKFKVKNIHKGALNLANGKIKPGGEGIATIAEYSTLSQYMTKV